ncbi:MAG: histidinol-phosphatase HisJ family protein [Thermoanaerobaculum sp.]|nr:histidinol-phosphatase HisJ family protein [Thermoanaerobaculum sp.]MDW7967273.1 histidinol-phosphatase HisJ family protein [Thermoanaerobaculum sp.]
MRVSALADLHTHTFRCGHAVGTEEEYVRQAVRLGLKAVAITDHIPFYWLPPEAHDPTLAMAPEELPAYVEAVLQLKGRYRGRVEVLLGIEADYVEGHEHTLAQILQTYPFDVVLGSVHWLAGFWVDAPTSLPEYQKGPERVQQIWARYWQTLEKAIRSGLFDVMAHLDLPKKFGFLPAEPLTELEDAVLQALLETGVAVELSSAGRRKPVGEDYPSPRWLARLATAGVPVVLSSDAHAPHEVGFAFALLQQQLQQLGVREVLTFRQRQPLALSLAEG